MLFLFSGIIIIVVILFYPVTLLVMTILIFLFLISILKIIVFLVRCHLAGSRRNRIIGLFTNMILNATEALLNINDDSYNENLRMMLFNRDFNSEDYDTLVLLDQHSQSSNLVNRNTQTISKKYLTLLPLGKYPAIQKLPFHKTYNQECCSICLEIFSDNDLIRLLPCSHEFHDQCLLQWLNEKGSSAQCPICKSEIFMSK